MINQKLSSLVQSLSSSLLIEGNDTCAYRDPAVLYFEGTFYLYCTLVETEPEGVFMYTALSESEDLIHWSPMRKLTVRDQSKNFSSPGNVVRLGEKWIMCLQTYCRENKEKYGNGNCRIFLMESTDLRTWSDPKPLMVMGDNISIEEAGRMIDPYLIEKDGLWYCYFKRDGKICYSTSLDLSHWTFQGNICGGENPSVIERDGKYYMFCSPQNGIAVKVSEDLIDWKDNGEILTFGQNHWDWARGRLTAGMVVQVDDGWLMFFHGTGPQDESVIFDTNACIGVAWSYDLKKWFWKE